MKKIISFLTAATTVMALADPVLDALYRAYSNEVKTANGRVKWYGKIVSSSIDTNAMTRTQIHESGFRYVEPFRPVNPKPLSKRLASTNAIHRTVNVVVTPEG